MIKVLIWENKRGLGAMNHPGHAALAITRGNTVDYYVSWWPEEFGSMVKSSKADIERGYSRGETNSILNDHWYEIGPRAVNALERGAEPRPGQTHELVVNDFGMAFLNPNMNWLQQPQTVISIPSIDDAIPPRRKRLGLCEANIKDWWDLYKMKLNEKVGAQTHHEYYLASKRYNCAAIVMAALRAGGSALYDQDSHGKRHDNWLYYTPLDVKEYANKVENRIDLLNVQVNSIYRFMLGDYQKYIPVMKQTLAEHNSNTEAAEQPDTRDLWSCEQWMKESSVKFGRRKDQIQAIDYFIQMYWAAGAVWDENNSKQKANNICNILSHVQDHIIQKPRSDRREAVLQLGSQCIMVLRRNSADNHLCQRIHSLIR